MARRRAERSAPRSQGSAAIWIIVGLVALVVLTYSPVGHFHFVNWDDPTYVTQNVDVESGLSWHGLAWALTTTHEPYWHPVTWLSHMLDVQMFGLAPGPPHLVNVAFHAANTVLLFAVIALMSGAIGRSAVIAAIFAVHPLHVESVAWVTERKDVLSTFFLLWTLLAYLAYVRRSNLVRYGLATVAFLLALMSKPMVVTLPLLLLLLDVWPLGRASLGAWANWRRLVVEKLPWLGLATAIGIGTVIVQRKVGALASVQSLSLSTRMSNALVSYVAYLAKTVWPVNLAPFYPIRPHSPWIVFSAASALAALTMAAVAARQRRPYVLVGWLWFVVTLLPVSGLAQAGEQAMADRFMYLPIVGLLLAGVWGLADVAGAWGRNASIALGTGALVVVVVCAEATRNQAEAWRDSIALWRHAIAVTNGNYLAYENLGQALRDEGDLPEALESYESALQTAPPDSVAYAGVIHNDIGLVLTLEAKPDQALTEFAEAVRLDPVLAEAHINFGNALASAGSLSEATEEFDDAIRLAPADAEAQLGRGNVALREGHTDDATTAYREAVRLKPGLAEAHEGLASALAMSGEEDEALREYAEAISLNPQLVRAHFNTAVLLARRGKVDEATEHLGKTLAIDANFPGARDLLRSLHR